MWGRSFDSWGFIRNLKWSHTFSFIEMNICIFSEFTVDYWGLFHNVAPNLFVDWWLLNLAGMTQFGVVQKRSKLFQSVCICTQTYVEQPIHQLYKFSIWKTYSNAQYMWKSTSSVQATFKWIETLLLFLFHIFFRLVVLCMTLVYDDCLDSAYTWFSAFFYKRNFHSHLEVKTPSAPPFSNGMHIWIALNNNETYFSSDWCVQ